MLLSTAGHPEAQEHPTYQTDTGVFRDVTTDGTCLVLVRLEYLVVLVRQVDQVGLVPLGVHH